MKELNSLDYSNYVENCKKTITIELSKKDPLDRPCFVVIINDNNTKSSHNAIQLQKVCNDVGIGFVAIKINKSSDHSFIYHNLRNLAEMPDITKFIIDDSFFDSLPYIYPYFIKTSPIEKIILGPLISVVGFLHIVMNMI